APRQHVHTDPAVALADDVLAGGIPSSAGHARHHGQLAVAQATEQGYTPELLEGRRPVIHAQLVVVSGLRVDLQKIERHGLGPRATHAAPEYAFHRQALESLRAV